VHRVACTLGACSLLLGCFADPTPLSEDGTSTSAGTTASTGSDDSGTSTSISTDPSGTNTATSSNPDSTGEQGGSRLQRIDIDTGFIDEALADVPSLLRLVPAEVEYDAMQPDGSDLRIYDASEAQLPFEVERWDPAGESLIWVRVGELEPGVPAQIGLGYGDPTVGAPPNPESVWSNGYVAVWHLADFEDATAFGHTLEPFDTPKGAPRPAPGFVGDGVQFKVEDDPLKALAPDDFALATAVTVEAWMNPSTVATTTNHRIAVRKGQAYRLVAVRQNNGRASFIVQLSDLATDVATDHGVPFVADEWRHLTGTFEGEAVWLYVDGVPSSSIGPSLPSLSVQGSTDLLLGGSDYLGGLDEVRVSNVVRSPSWIELQYRSVVGTLVTFHEPEPAG